MPPLRHATQLLFKLVDAILHPPPVDFQLRLTRTAPANATGQTRKRRTFIGQIGHEILKLRQLHLNFALSAMRSLGKNIQNQHGAVDDFELRALGNRPALTRGQTLVKNQQISPDLQPPDNHFIELAPTNQIVRINAVSLLDNPVRWHHPAGLRQFGELVEGLLCRDFIARGHTHQNRTLSIAAHRIGALRAFKLFFEGLNKAHKVLIQLADRQVVLDVPLKPLRVVRQQ